MNELRAADDVQTPSPCLLAVDLGLRTGLAAFDIAGRLLWHRSHNFGNYSRLRHGCHGILKNIPELDRLILEGNGRIAAMWRNEGVKLGLAVRTVNAETWRADLLPPSLLHDSERAKKKAGDIARRIIEDSGLPRPTSLRLDAAEAICLGWWAMQTP